ncbi:hypothetical protein COLO4_00725 [Corchorus olitorius]|uniref:Uncharacterized protein n=1 Tax=Corchorus olitorius TaxID=93759 RepID=A0A1R3L3M4_9ROSI|nr:hypothetical protein COLO4_00725 [Corchorus olitorius]
MRRGFAFMLRGSPLVEARRVAFYHVGIAVDFEPAVAAVALVLLALDFVQLAALDAQNVLAVRTPNYQASVQMVTPGSGGDSWSNAGSTPSLRQTAAAAGLAPSALLAVTPRRIARAWSAILSALTTASVSEHESQPSTNWQVTSLVRRRPCGTLEKVTFCVNQVRASLPHARHSVMFISAPPAIIRAAEALVGAAIVVQVAVGAAVGRIGAAVVVEVSIGTAEAGIGASVVVQITIGAAEGGIGAPVVVQVAVRAAARCVGAAVAVDVAVAAGQRRQGGGQECDGQRGGGQGFHSSSPSVACGSGWCVCRLRMNSHRASPAAKSRPSSVSAALEDWRLISVAPVAWRSAGWARPWPGRATRLGTGWRRILCPGAPAGDRALRAIEVRAQQLVGQGDEGNDLPVRPALFAQVVVRHADLAVVLAEVLGEGLRGRFEGFGLVEGHHAAAPFTIAVAWLPKRPGMRRAMNFSTRWRKRGSVMCATGSAASMV